MFISVLLFQTNGTTETHHFSTEGTATNEHEWPVFLCLADPLKARNCLQSTKAMPQIHQGNRGTPAAGKTT